MKTKICGGCATRKFISEFHKDAGNKVWGVRAHCKKCISKRKKEFRESGRLKVTVYETPIPTVTEKRCPRCKKTKPASEFSKNRRTANGITVYCKLCLKDYRDERKSL